LEIEMNVTREDAVAALRDIEGAESRARTARAYRTGAPHLILWGAIWIVGYTLTGLLPSRMIGLLWIILSLAGAAGSVLFGMATAKTAASLGVSHPGKTGLAMALAIWLFVVATYWVMRPGSGAQYEVFPAMIVSLVYALAGARGKPKYLGIGAVVFVLSLIGFAFLRPILPFWLAAVGGGSLILGGFWLRQP
jgi:hypothetical protein